jgi:molybdate transport system substrate-binding protein
VKRLTALLAFLLLACGGREEALQVDAAASLSDALTEAGEVWTSNTRQAVWFNFAGSGTLARQIESGAPGDVFISADERQMDRVAAKSLIVPSTRRDVLANTLVVVAHAGSTIRTARDLERVSRLAIGDPAIVPAGAYAREFLERSGVWTDVATKLVPTENVRGALAAVSSGNADAAIVYRSDVTNRRDVAIAFQVPAQSTSPIRYPAAVLRSSRDETSASRFVAFLSSPQAGAIFKRHGFTVLR